MPRRLVKTFNTVIIAVIIGLQVSVLITYWYFTFFQKTGAATGIRETIFYQGKIADSNSVPPTSADYNMKFLIYDAATSGTLLWTETWDNTNQGESASQVNINNGIFAVELNSLCGNWQGGCASNGGVNFNTDTLYLEVQFDSDSNGSYEEVFTPRKRLTAIPYALNAGKVGGLSIATTGSGLPDISADNTWSGIQTIQPSDAANQGLILKGASGQSEDLQEWQTSTGEVLASLSATGALSVSSFSTSEITSDKLPNGGVPIITGSTVAYWNLDDLTGTTAADATANNLDGTITDAAFVTGYFGYTGDYALSFDGADDVQVADNDALDGFDTFTFEAWVKTSSSGTVGLVNKYKNSGTVTDDAYQVTLANGIITVKLGGGSTTSTVATGSTAINDDAWHHVAFVFDKPTSYIYVDGVYDDAATYNSFNNTIHASTDALYLGAVNNNGTLINKFNGTLDNPVLYNAALSANTILTHYNDGAGSGVAFVVDTQQEFVGSDAKLFSVRNNGEEKAYFANDGDLTIPQLNTTGQSVFTLDTDTQALIIKANENQSANLVEFQSNTGTVFSSIDSGGILSTTAISSRQVVSNATETGSVPTLDEAFQKLYWLLDDGTGSTASDETSNALEGTTNNTTWAGSGYFDYTGDDSLTFNGTTAYVSRADDPLLNPGTGSFSVEGWAKPTAFGSGTGGWNDTLISKHTTDFANGYALIVDNTSGVPEFKVSDGTNTASASGTTQLTLDSWYHLVGVWDATAKVAYLYVNGELAASAGEAGMGTVTTSSAFEVGRYNHSTQSRYDYFTGDIDTVIYSSKALSGSEASLHYSDGVSVGLSIDTSENFTTSGSKLLSLRNNGTEKISFDKDGSISSSGQIILSLASDIKGFIINAFSGQTANLQEWVDSSGSVTSAINSIGLLDVPSLTSKGIISDATEAGTAPAVDSENALGYWEFDENTGSSLNDETSNNNDATATSTSWATSGQFGYSGDYALTFDGAASNVSTPVSLSGGTNPFTAELWFNSTSTTTDQDIIGQLDGSNKLFRVNINGINSGQLTFRIIDSGAGNNDIVADINKNQWHHLAAVWDGTNQLLYIDGKLIGTQAITAPSATQTASVLIGKHPNASSDYFNGDIDNPIVYDDARRAGEIFASYESGRGGRALVVDTSNTYASGKLVTFNNNGVERVSFDYNGSVTSSGLILKQLSGQSGSILDIQDSSDASVFSVGVDGTTTIGGGFIGSRTAITSSSYTVLSTDYIIDVNYGGTVSLTLPTASGIEGQVYIFKDLSGNASTNTITITPNGVETIDGSSNATITTDYGALTIYSDGTNWFTL